MAKVIAVLGATGMQGGGLCQAILNDPSGDFTCRAITRDLQKHQAQQLRADGAEVVPADLDDVESLKEAFEDAHGVYAVTNFWEHFSGEKEKEQAKNIAEAAADAGVHHIIWSTLEDTRGWMPEDDPRMPMLQETYRVPHFDAKAEADAYFRELPTTFLRTSFYWDNLYSFGLEPKKGESGQYEWAFPLGDAKMAGIAGEDIGKVALGIFKAGDEYIGQTIGIAGGFLTIEEMGETLSQQLGIGPIAYHAVDADTYRGFGFPGADEMGNMFQVYRDFEVPFNANRSVDLARELNPDLLSFEDWVARYKDKIPL
jgi:uncharacterized protein YbjT (DUF2867 family)